MSQPTALFSDTFDLPLTDIHADPARFQGRLGEYSEDTVNAIVGKGHYDRSKSPITVWRDPVNGKFYILSGHSRFEAAKRIYASGKQPELASLPVKQMMVDDVTAAIEYAVLESNRKSTEEGLVPDIMAYRKAVELGKNSAYLKSIFRPDSRFQRLKELSKLNPKGMFIEQLAAASQHSFPYLERNARWVGNMRAQFPALTDLHERELFDYLYGSKKALNITKQQFFDLVNSKVSRIDFDPANALNLANRISPTAYTDPLNEQLREIDKQIEAAQKEIERHRTTIARAKSEGIEPPMYQGRISFDAQIGMLNGYIIRKMEEKATVQQNANRLERTMGGDLFSQVAENVNAKWKGAPDAEIMDSPWPSEKFPHRKLRLVKKGNDYVVEGYFRDGYAPTGYPHSVIAHKTPIYDNAKSYFLDLLEKSEKHPSSPHEMDQPQHKQVEMMSESQIKKALNESTVSLHCFFEPFDGAYAADKKERNSDADWYFIIKDGIAIQFEDYHGVDGDYTYGSRYPAYDVYKWMINPKTWDNEGKGGWVSNMSDQEVFEALTIPNKLTPAILELIVDCMNRMSKAVGKDRTKFKFPEISDFETQPENDIDEKMEDRKVSSFSRHVTPHPRFTTLYVASYRDRVSKQQFDADLARAKKVGGWYSSYNKNGAVAGFQFKTETALQDFTGLMAPLEPLAPQASKNEAPAAPEKERTLPYGEIPYFNFEASYDKLYNINGLTPTEELVAMGILRLVEWDKVYNRFNKKVGKLKSDKYDKIGIYDSYIKDYNNQNRKGIVGLATGVAGRMVKSHVAVLNVSPLDVEWAKNKHAEAAREKHGPELRAAAKALAGEATYAFEVGDIVTFRSKRWEVVEKRGDGLAGPRYIIRELGTVRELGVHEKEITPPASSHRYKVGTFVMLKSDKAAQPHLVESHHTCAAGNNCYRISPYPNGKAEGLVDEDELLIYSTTAGGKPETYFDLPANAVNIPLANVYSTKDNKESSYIVAASRMREAANGWIPKRGPITVEKMPDGRHHIKDGNATFEVAKRSGWDYIPAVVVNEQNSQMNDPKRKRMLMMAKAAAARARALSI